MTTYDDDLGRLICRALGFRHLVARLPSGVERGRALARQQKTLRQIRRLLRYQLADYQEIPVIL